MSVSRETEREREKKRALPILLYGFPSSFLSQLFVLPWLTVSFLFSGKWLGQRLALSILSQGVVSRCCVLLSPTIFSNIEPPTHRTLAFLFRRTSVFPSRLHLSTPLTYPAARSTPLESLAIVDR